MAKRSNSKAFTRVVLVIYLIMLVWYWLFRLALTKTAFHEVFTLSYRGISLIPFAKLFIAPEYRLAAVREFLLNIAVFAPFGILLSNLRKPGSVLGRVAAGAAAGLVLEALQYLFAIGGSDITDVLAAALGTLLGVVIHAGTGKLMRSKPDTLFNVILLILELLIITGVIASVFLR